MTKERFDEIRKREYAEDRVVYVVYFNYKEVMPLYIVNDDEWIIAYLNLDNVYETKEQAEWALKTVAERTERFEPPMWEDIKDSYGFSFMGNDENFYFFCVEKIVDKVIFLHCNFDLFDNKVFRDMNATKENYEKACGIVRDLFKEAK